MSHRGDPTNRAANRRIIRSAALAVIALCPARTLADIFQWQWVDPNNPALGKIQSTTLCPDGAGVDAVPFQGLSGLDLTQAYLISTDLRSSSMNNTILSMADLGNANLSLASLYGSDLSGASLKGANLIGAQLSAATLANAQLTGADLTACSLGGVTDLGFTSAQLYSTASYQSHILQLIGFTANDLTGWNFSNQNLFKSAFASSTLTSANFSGAVINGTDFSDSRGLTAAQIYSTSSYQAHDLHELRFSSIELSGVDFSTQNLSGTSFDSASLSGANFAGANVSSATFRGTTHYGFTAPQLYATANYAAHQLSDVNLESNNLMGWDFSGQQLAGTSFRWATLTNADFSGAQVAGANLAVTTQFGFTAPQLYSTASYQARDLTGISLSDNDLSGWDLSNQNLTNAYLGGATLTNTNFAGAVVAGANFNDTTLRGFKAEQLYSTASYQHHDLRGLLARGENVMSGWDFSGQNMSDASLAGVLTSINFSGANLTRVQFRGDLSGSNFAGADLTSGDLVATDLSRVNFTGANLTSAAFTVATLTQANLSGATLKNASFMWAILTGANLQNASFAQSSFSGADLSSANFSHTNLANARIVGSTLSGADFNGATLSYTNLSGAINLDRQQIYSTASYQQRRMFGLGLAGLDLSGWDFSAQNLTDASFAMSDLTNTSLAGACLIGANFGGATINNTDFSGTDLRYTNGLPASVLATPNVILPDSTINGLHLGSGQNLRIWNSNAGIRILNGMTMAHGSTLKFRLDGLIGWGDIVSFDPAGSIALGGTLELDIEPDANLGGLIGTNLTFFNWGRTIDGANRFEQIMADPRFKWDVSGIYQTGRVSLLGLFGDANEDWKVDSKDLGILARNWQRGTSTPAPPNWFVGDFDGNGTVDIRDLMKLASNWGYGADPGSMPSLAAALAEVGLPSQSVPESAIGPIAVISALTLCSRRRPERPAEFDRN